MPKYTKPTDLVILQVRGDAMAAAIDAAVLVMRDIFASFPDIETESDTRTMYALEQVSAAWRGKPSREKRSDARHYQPVQE